MPKKTWNVWGRESRARVQRDEARAAEQAEKLRREAQEREANAVFELLKRRAAVDNDSNSAGSISRTKGKPAPKAVTCATKKAVEGYRFGVDSYARKSMHHTGSDGQRKLRETKRKYLADPMRIIESATRKKRRRSIAEHNLVRTSTDSVLSGRDAPGKHKSAHKHKHRQSKRRKKGRKRKKAKKEKADKRRTT